MMNIKGIFAVSLIAMVAMVAGAHTSNAVAAIASQGYVDQQVGLKANATELARKVDIYQGDAKANQAVITNGTGNITTGFITKSMLGADVEIPDEYELPPATANALGGVKSGGDITVATSGTVTVNSATKATQDASGKVIASTYATKNELTTGLSGKQNSLGYTAENSANKVTSANYDANVSNDTKYPTVKAVADAIADVEKTIPDAITVDSALSSTSTNPVQNKVINTALSGKVTIAQGSGAANKAVITNSSGNVTTGTISSGMIADGTIVNADIAADAKIETSKISGLAKVATTGLYGDLTGTPTIPTVNNATLTIQKNGSTVDTFTANASANKTINITVPTQTSQLTNNSGFITADDLPVATANTLGGVKSGGYITVDTSGVVTVNSAKTATNAKTATHDAGGNVITDTYATKAQLTALDSTSEGTGAVVTNVSQKDGKVSVTKGNVQIPVGSATATTYATIWVQ